MSKNMIAFLINGNLVYGQTLESDGIAIKI